MELDDVLIKFLLHSAAGAASVLVIILFAGIGIPRRSPAIVPRTRR